eukprot:TRINITY_DN5243_c0_g1_i10.p1 TRINITY_DN5243_c0_g1~~TRINITY_DN5243_c0_g1_i10.p1  ORF type:complete len:102 (+),score=14.31 TRINITY_DN5243_c0_g1_i10:66-371(+)
MARSGVLTLIVACATLALFGTVALSFVGSASPGLRTTPKFEGLQRVPDVAMQFFGGEPATTTTTTPPPMSITVEDPNTYIIGFTLFFFASVAANASGFYNP